MPPPVPLIQQCSWPGVRAVASLYYTISHGISPGLAVLTTYPQDGPVAAHGDLVIGDGKRGVRLRDCRVSRTTCEGGPQGQTWTLEIQDRRWRWTGLGAVSGDYNRLDARGKLVPWTVRSPDELAKLCLDAMGERNYRVILPDGLPRSAGADTERFLKAGENFAQSLTNPPTVWEKVPPAQALAALADLYGCRVVYQPLQDRILVTPLGRGRPLPVGPCEAMSTGADNPRVPYAVAVAGAPVRIQARFALEAVGEDWDGSYKPIDDLSYAPKVPPQPQISRATFTGSGNPSTMGVVVTVGQGALDAFDVTFSVSTASAGTVAGKIAALAAEINADKDLKPVLTAAATATTLTLTGKNGGLAFGLKTTVFGISSPPDKWEAVLVQPAGPANQRSWRYCPPPLFATVEAVGGRLSYGEAQALAQKSVFRCYRLLFVDPYRGTPPLRLPWYKGKLVRRQQINLEPTKVAQVVPSPRLPGAANANNPIKFQLPLAGLFGGAVLPEFYNGYSRDQAATVNGSAFIGCGGQVVWALEGKWNTDVGDRVHCGFEIDPYEQIVVFSDYVYAMVDGGYGVVPSALTLETACTVSDADTGQLARWEDSLVLGGVAPTEWQVREDLRVGVIGQYRDPPDTAAAGNGRNALVGWAYAPGDQEDAKGRARYYLDGMAAKFQLPQSDNRQYIGIYPIEPDGAVQQVSWSIGPGGPTTTASTNSEFSVAVPAYPTRRRAELLAENQAARLANIAERAIANIPNPGPQPMGIARAAGAPPG